MSLWAFGPTRAPRDLVPHLNRERIQRCIHRSRGQSYNRGLSESSRPVSVCVVSDVRFYREGLARVLAFADGILVPVTAPAGADGLREIVESRSDVVLLDATMPATGLVAHQLAAALPDAKIVALAVPQAEEELTVLLDAGVVGYVTREQSLEEVVATILDVAAEQMVCPPRLRTLVGKRVRALASGSAPSVDARLTARELEILDLVAQGLLNKEIGRALHIQEATVKNHMHHILEKLNVQTRMAAVAEVRHRGRPALGTSASASTETAGRAPARRGRGELLARS